MADLVKGPIVDGPEGAARELKDMLEALQAERAAVAAWLRRIGKPQMADAIERGEHLK